MFNTFEGGAIICPDAKTKKRIDYLKNFGFSDEVTVVAPGINGKMNEVQAAFGLLQLKHVDQLISRRGEIDQRYRDGLNEVQGVSCLPLNVDFKFNYSYFPIRVGRDYALSRDGLYEALKEAGIFSRRYFYPLISDMPMYRGLSSAAASNLPVASLASQQVLCLPIYPDLTNDQVDAVIDLIKSAAVI